MKLFLALSALLGSIAALAQQPASTSGVGPDTHSCSNPEAIHTAQQMMDTWKAAYNAGDAARVAALYADNADYLTQHFVTGLVHGRTQIQAYVQRGVDARFHIDSIQILSIGCVPDLIYVVDRYQSTNAGQKAMGVNLVVVRRTAAGWRIVAHEAAVPDPATAVQQLDVPAAH
ncbi:MAG: nuclear transport factor 2 family protein [Terracidiphilus sp.]